jgi:hypothetical protein
MANVKTLPNLQELSSSPSRAQTLPSEAVLDALKMMLIGASLNEVPQKSPEHTNLRLATALVTASRGDWPG